MSNYWLTQDLLKAASFGFLALAALGIVLALWLPKKGWQKGVALVMVLLLISIPVRQGVKEVAQEQKAVDDYKERYAKAKALFDERCKTTGEKIYKTVENVEGVLLMKVRQHDADKSDPMMAGAAAAYESQGDFYIRSFLLSEVEPKKSRVRALVEDRTQTTRQGYKYVDVIDPADGKRYRYTVAANARMKRELATGQTPRYGVTFEDIVDANERKYWIAGSTVKVIDLKTKETLGEFTHYVIDRGQGSRAGARTPWLFADSCDGANYGRNWTRFFTDQVLKPKQGD